MESVLKNSRDWMWYTRKLDADAAYEHRHIGEPERYPCLVSSRWEEDSNGPYTYVHSFIYQRKTTCPSCGAERVEWDAETALKDSN